MIIAKKYEIPDRCPSKCPFRDDKHAMSLSAYCFRCPIFNCFGDEPMIEPDDYREDWAEEWYNFFNNEYKEYPKMKIFK